MSTISTMTQAEARLEFPCPLDLGETNGDAELDTIASYEADYQDRGDEEEIDLICKSWTGPPVPRDVVELLVEWPSSLDWPPTEPCHLGKVVYKVISTDRVKYRLEPPMVMGRMAEFFPAKETMSALTPTSVYEFYTPSQFLPKLFFDAVRGRFGLVDIEFSLWMLTDQRAPCLHIANHTCLVDALQYFVEHVVDKEPFRHYVLSFLVEVHDEQTKTQFSKLAQPADLLSVPSRQTAEASVQTDPTDSSPMLSHEGFAQIGRSIYSPAMTLSDAFSQTEGGDYTPEGSSADDISDGEISNRSDSVYSSQDESDASAESEGLKQMADAVYISPTVAILDTLEPESVGTPGILESIDTDTKHGKDVVDGDLDSILPVSNGPADDEFDAICSFMLLEPNEHKDPVVRSVAIPHTDIRITPRQYVSALAMVSSCDERGINGGILADAPGTGKTHTCIAAVLLRALIAYNMAEVKKEWETREYEAARGKGSKSREFKHLPRDAGRGEACPCGNQLGIVCYADADGVTRKIGDAMSRGVSLILAPQGVIEEWKTLLVGAKLNRKFFEPCLIHTTAHRELACPPFFDKRFQLKATARQDGFPRGYKPQVVDFDYTYTMDTEQGKQPERFIIVTTHQIEKLRETFQVPVMVTVGNKKERMSVYGLPVGAMLVDEFHKVRAKGSPVVQLAQEHKRIMGDRSDFWSVSGTIMPKNSFADLDSTISILERPPWNESNHRHHNKRLVCVQELEEDYLKAVSADQGSEAVVEAFKQRAADFFSSLLIRHTMDSRFFGKRITKMKEVKPAKKTFTTPADHLEDLQALADQVKGDIRAITQTDSYEQVVRSLQTYIELTPLQVASTFPAAARLILDGSLKVDISSLRALIKKAKGNVAAVPEFAAVADAVTTNSAKLEHLVTIFQQMESDSQARPKPDSDGANDTSPRSSHRENRQLKKLVVVTPTLGEAVFLYLGLRKRLPGTKTVALLHADLLASEKQRLTNDFRALHPGSARVLVTPYEVGGTGFNLQTANYQVLTGPLRTKDYEVQAFARTNREGSVLRLHHFLYLTDDNPADRLIVARQANRRAASDAFDVKEGFTVEGAEDE